MSAKPVKHFHSGMAGAPVLTGQVGKMIDLLDACLVNGFNLLTLDSLVVSANELTGTKSGHGFLVDQVIVTSGANESALNDEWTITSVTANAFKAAATGVANTTGTGTISAKAAPLGWEKTYSGTNKAAYRSKNSASTRAYLRVDDTATIVARVVGYESMTDVDTGSGPFPTAAQVSGGASWHKSYTADSTARSWNIVGDADGFISVRQSYGTNAIMTDYFGDFISEKPGDAFRCMLSGTTASAAQSSSQYSNLSLNSGAAAAHPIWCPRSYSALGSAITMEICSNSFGVTISGGAGALQYPSPASNGIILAVPALRETSGPVRTTAVPGLYMSPLNLMSLSDRDKIDNIDAIPGKTLMVMASQAAGQQGRVLVDITGPWR